MQNDSGSDLKRGWICSSIGRKQLIGLTGLGLAGFLLTHMAGNMLILAGPEPYNKYSHALISNPLIYIAEGGLLAAFVAHLIFALWISWKNMKSRDTRYAVQPAGDKRTGWTYRTLWAQGLLILVFTILHLATFKYGTHYTANYGGVEMRDLHRLVIEVFHEPGYVIWYVVALFVLMFHLGHGVRSSLQTWGVHHPRYQCAFRGISWGYAIIVTLGFLSQPIYVFFFN